MKNLTFIILISTTTIITNNLLAQDANNYPNSNATSQSEPYLMYDSFILQVTIDSLIQKEQCHCYSNEKCYLFKVDIDSVFYFSDPFFKNNDSFIYQINLLCVREEQLKEVAIGKAVILSLNYYFDYRILDFSKSFSSKDDINIIRPQVYRITPMICGKRKLLNKSKLRKGISEETIFSKYIDENFVLPTELKERIANLKGIMKN